MEKAPKKKHHRKGKKKVQVNDSSFESKPPKPKVTKIKAVSFPKELSKKRISLHSSNHIPLNIYEPDNDINFKNFTNIEEDNYFEITSKKREEIQKIDNEINSQFDNKNVIINFLKEIENSTNYEIKICCERIKEIYEEKNYIKKQKEKINELKRKLDECEEEKNKHKELFEQSENVVYNDIILKEKEIETEKNNLIKKQQENNELSEKIPEIKDNIIKYEEEINQEKNLYEKLTKDKNELKEKYFKINKTVINDNKFCHDNFFSLLTLFPYYKNVAFISYKNSNITEKIENLDDNKIIIEDIENEDFNNIKYMLKQKEDSERKENFRILNDRRTLQINPKEKYKFQKIFSIINNKYIAEPWNYAKYSYFKLSTINSYFNEFNMTAISNNYFIIYFVPSLDKTSTKGELYPLFQQLKNNEYIDKNIVIKISAITESNYINIQNINQENNIKNQISTISESNPIYGFLYEFIKSNRLNKKNIFRIYNFDYSYPYAIDMMTNIAKYYAKKKRKKTGVYKKVIRQQGKGRKKLADKNGNNNINNLNKNNKKNNLNKIQPKKNGNINIRNTSLNNNNQNNKIIKNKNENKKILNISSLDNKNIMKKPGSTHQSKQKEKKLEITSKHNIKFVKFEDDKTESMTPKKNNSANKELTIKKNKINSIVFNDLKNIKPEHTLILHIINYEFVLSNEFKNVAKACGILNNNNEK